MTDDDSAGDGSAAGDESGTGDEPTVEGESGAETDQASESEPESVGDTWEPRPVPDVTPETMEFWRGAAEDRFLLCECGDCGLVYYYPRALCPDCFGGTITWREASGGGSIYSYSIARQVSGWPEKALPLVVAYIELDEGPRVMTNVVDCDPADVAVGTRVEARFVPTTTTDVAIPVFAPIE